MAAGSSREEETRGVSRLWWWICFSGVLHILIILTLFIVPQSTARRRIPSAVYTVELIGGGGLPGELPAVPKAELKPPTPAAPAKAPPPAAAIVEEAAIEPEEIDDPVTFLPTPEPTQSVPIEKSSPKTVVPEVVMPTPPKQVKKEEPKPKVGKSEPKRSEAAKNTKKLSNKKTKKDDKKKTVKKVAKRKPKPAAKNVAKKNRKRDELARQRLREKRIQAAVAKARDRAAQQRRSPTVGRRDSRSQVASVGGADGRRIGTGAGDGSGRGGGVVKGLEFVVYRNRMLNQIKSSWTWVGKRNDLEVTVRFGIAIDGQIFALEIVGASGDNSYDDSVVRAVKRASPLPPPPANYLQDFSDVELTFRPRDLNG